MRLLKPTQSVANIDVSLLFTVAISIPLSPYFKTLENINSVKQVTA